MSEYKHQALHEIYGSQGLAAVVEPDTDDGEWILYDETGNVLDLDVNAQAVLDKIAEIEASSISGAYVQERLYAYPSIQEQLDMMYHDKVDGTTTWQDAIAAVKTAYPKGDA